MAWARVEGRSAWHPKVLQAGNEAWGALMRMTAHSVDQLSDGKLSAAEVTLIAKRKAVIDKLIAAGLLERDGDHYVVHDFHDYNPIAAEEAVRLQNLAEKRAAAGRKGARGRWQNDGKPDGKTMRLPCDGDGKTKVVCHDVAIDTKWQTDASDPDPDPDLDLPPEDLGKNGNARTFTRGFTNGEAKQEVPPPRAGAAPKTKHRHPETHCPPSDAKTSEIALWCEQWRIPPEHHEFQAFLDCHRKKGSRWRDWAAAWRGWLRNADKFAPAKSGVRIVQQPPPGGSTWQYGGGEADLPALLAMAGSRDV